MKLDKVKPSKNVTNLKGSPFRKYIYELGTARKARETERKDDEFADILAARRRAKDYEWRRGEYYDKEGNRWGYLGRKANYPKH